MLYPCRVRLLVQQGRQICHIRHQYSALRTLKEHVGENGVVLQMNFCRKLSSYASFEIQGVDFGASNQQAPLCTGPAQGGCQSALLAHRCTITHLQSGLYLNKVLPYLKELNPTAATLHVISDGPGFLFLEQSPPFRGDFRGSHGTFWRQAVEQLLNPRLIY